MAADYSEKIVDILGSEYYEMKGCFHSVKEMLKKSINKNYFNSKTLNYDNGKQGINLFALYLGLVPDKFVKPMFKKVVEHYRKHPRFDTGIIITPALLDYLSDNGEAELAYKIFTSRGKPSFHSMLKDETTLCENWNKVWPEALYDSDGHVVETYQVVSHCHPMYGSVVAWMHKHIAGLDLSFLYEKKIIIKPKLISSIRKAEARKMTPYGLASVCYNKGNKFVMNIQVPYGCTAELTISCNDVSGLTLGNEKISPSKGCYNLILDGGSYILAGK